MASPRLTPTPQPAASQAAPAQYSLSPRGRTFIVQREGGYVDHFYNDNAGHCTFGAGTLVRMAGCTPDELRRHLTPAEIEQPLLDGIQRAERAVRRNVTVNLAQSQFDALVSLVYNAGPGAHGTQDGAQPMFQEVNRRGADAAARRLLTTAIHSRHVDNAGHVTMQVNRGLVNRRQLELALYQGR